MLRATLLVCLAAAALPVAAQRSPNPPHPSAADTISPSADREMRIQTLLRFVADAQAYYRKPRAFGGGNQSFDGLTLERLGYRTDADGRYGVSFNGRAWTHTYALRESRGVVTITSTSDRYGGELRAVIRGPDREDATFNFRVP